MLEHLRRLGLAVLRFYWYTVWFGLSVLESGVLGAGVIASFISLGWVIGTSTWKLETLLFGALLAMPLSLTVTPVVGWYLRHTTSQGRRVLVLPLGAALGAGTLMLLLEEFPEIGWFGGSVGLLLALTRWLWRLRR